MTQLNPILTPIKEGLKAVEQKLKHFSSASDLPFLDELLHHSFKSEGKRARPALTLLAAGFHSNNVENVIRMATAVEMLHVATLIHDDTVDEAATRRGKITVSNAWGQHTAILLGDYIFAASATYVCDTGNIKVIRRFSETIMELSRGQLQEMAFSHKLEAALKEYQERIYFKTASLFQTSGESGAILSGAPEEHIKCLTDYSRNIGLAFQVIDDILDFCGNSQTVGKPIGNDLKNGIVTLPTIYAMENDILRNRVAEFFRATSMLETPDELIKNIKSSGAIERSYEYATSLAQKARNSLSPLPNTPHRESLEELTQFVVSRTF